MHSPSAGRQADTFPVTDDRSALDAVARRLTCPHCGAAPLQRDARSLRCPRGHSFDIARQGYVSLLSGRRRHRGDDAAMVAAREAVLGGGHYQPLRSTITALVAEHSPPTTRLVVDLAGGTGHYLSPILDALPASWGLTVDLSAAALRRASRTHRLAAAVAADVWEPLPLAGRTAGVVLSVFGPRNTTEIDRILTADGIVTLATAGPEHLWELRDRLGMIGVDPRKADRLRRAFAGFSPIAGETVRWRLAVKHDEARALVAMGPGAHHLDLGQRDQAIDALPGLTGITAEIDVAVLRRHR
ncbi:putative RNA methyltransferase [Pseudonocardia sp. NPDC049635]|uniref:putative RNA methyltransferase n=1 Tax=Pseudonocardia sp. NPDC049635 TaxID=3155506 RepID=UPI0033E8B30D